MKILLIFPRFKYPSGDTPLGIAYLASYIRKFSDHDAEILDTTFDKSMLRTIRKIKRGDFDVIGIYANVILLEYVFKIAEISKTFHPEIPVIVGGPHASVQPELILKNKNVDAVVIGEGEKTLVEILNAQLNFDGIKGVWYKKNGKTIKNLPREPIQNIDEIPFPARDLLDMKKYTKLWYQLDSVSPLIKGDHVISSRGCMYNCTFCQPTLRKIFGPFVKYRSPKNIADEIELLIEKYKINGLIFDDDTFIQNKKWVEEIVNEFGERKFDIIWGCNVRANLVNKEILEKMYKVGLRKIYIGIESLSQRVLDEIYHKGITIKQIEDSIRIAKQLGIRIQGFFMIGAPTETLEEMKKTIEFAVHSEIDEAMFSITTPIPGTYLYEKYKYLVEKNAEFDYYKSYSFKASKTKKRAIEFLKTKAYIDFYLNPKRIITTIKQTNPISMQKTLLKLTRL